MSFDPLSKNTRISLGAVRSPIVLKYYRNIVITVVINCFVAFTGDCRLL